MNDCWTTILSSLPSHSSLANEFYWLDKPVLSFHSHRVLLHVCSSSTNVNWKTSIYIYLYIGVNCCQVDAHNIFSSTDSLIVAIKLEWTSNNGPQICAPIRYSADTSHSAHPFVCGVRILQEKKKQKRATEQFITA